MILLDTTAGSAVVTTKERLDDEIELTEWTGTYTIAAGEMDIFHYSNAATDMTGKRIWIKNQKSPDSVYTIMGEGGMVYHSGDIMNGEKYLLMDNLFDYGGNGCIMINAPDDEAIEIAFVTVTEQFIDAPEIEVGEEITLPDLQNNWGYKLSVA